jgi:carboxylesterase
MTDFSMHQAYLNLREDTDTVVVFIHGILGGPGQFSFLVQEALNRNAAAANLLLPGHGKTGRDFAHSSAAVWMHYVDEFIDSMRQKYNSIILVGHSMGCLLAIETYIKNPEKICGLFCLNMPLYLRIPPGGIYRSLKIAFNKGIIDEADAILKAARDAYSITKTTPYDYLTWLPRFTELLNLMHTTRRQLGKVNIPISLVYSARDEYVSLRSIRISKAKLSHCITSVELLQSSGHYYYPAGDLETVLRTFKHFLSSITTIPYCG